MSIFDPTGSSLVSTTKPAAFCEALYLLQKAEQADSEPQDNVTISYNDDLSAMTIAVILPVSIATGASGILSVTANNYTNSAVTAGGDLSGTTNAAAVLELAQMMVAAEDAEFLADPEFQALTSLAINANNSTATVSATYPATSAVVSGKLQITASDFLS